MKKQKGFATLFVSLMLVMLVTLNVFIGAKASLEEQKSSNNNYRTEQALQNADAGVKVLIANLKSYLAANPTVTTLSITTLTDPSGNYKATYNPTNNIITSVGKSSGNATRTVTQRIVLNASSGSGPSALTALGSVTLSGSASATDIKAGGTITTGSGTTVGATAGGSSEFRVNLLDHNGNILTDASGVAVTRSMTTDEYFMYYFGGLCPVAKAAGNAAGCKAEAKTTISASSTGVIIDNRCQPQPNTASCAPVNDPSSGSGSMSAAYTAGKRIFWLEGGLAQHFTLGTLTDPVIVLLMDVVSGSTVINGSSTLDGVIYIDILDQRTTTTCSCQTDANVQSSTPVYVNDITKPVYTLSASGAAHCTSNGGCTDSLGNKIPKGSYYNITYQQKIGSYTLTFNNFSNTNLNVGQPSMCTVAACAAAVSTATMLSCTGNSAVNSTDHCSFTAPAVSGSNDSQVQIEITGTESFGGSGNTIITGAAITSGSVTNTQGNVSFIKSSSIIANSMLTGFTGAGFINHPASISVVPNGWSDMN